MTAVQYRLLSKAENPFIKASPTGGRKPKDRSHIADPAGTKQCQNCRETRSKLEFNLDSYKKDGLSSYCRTCTLANHKRYAKEGRKYAIVPDGYRRCTKCREILLLDQFGDSKSQFLGKNHYCKPCAKLKDQQYRIAKGIKPSGRNIIGIRQPKGIIPDGYRWCSRCGEYKLLNEFSMKSARCRFHEYEKGRQCANKAKKLALAAYGNKCATCKEINPLFLSFDHIDNSGAAHRRSTSYATNLPAWLVSNNFPPGFQILCHNCNFIKMRESYASVNQSSQQRLRLNVLTAYGVVCVCCGSTDIRCLTMDHINNDARQWRDKGMRSVEFYSWLRKNNYPRDIAQVMCFNCNMGKRLSGICPHSSSNEVEY